MERYEAIALKKAIDEITCFVANPVQLFLLSFYQKSGIFNLRIGIISCPEAVSEDNIINENKCQFWVWHGRFDLKTGCLQYQTLQTVNRPRW